MTAPSAREYLASLTEPELRARLQELDAERRAVMTLLQAVRRRDRERTPRSEADKKGRGRRALDN